MPWSLEMVFPYYITDTFHKVNYLNYHELLIRDY